MHKKGEVQRMAYLASGDSSVAALDEVGGRRRGSWRRFETPASLLNEADDLLSFWWLLEKLLFCARLNILASQRPVLYVIPNDCSCRYIRPCRKMNVAGSVAGVVGIK
jgi:hypothetical protein